MAHIKSGCIPQAWSKLPLIHKMRSLSLKKHHRICLRKDAILLEVYRVVHIDAAFCGLFGGRGFSAPFESLYQDNSRRFQLILQERVRYPWSIVISPVHCRIFFLRQIYGQKSTFTNNYQILFGKLAVFRSPSWPIFVRQVGRRVSACDMRLYHNGPCHSVLAPNLMAYSCSQEIKPQCNKNTPIPR